MTDENYLLNFVTMLIFNYLVSSCHSNRRGSSRLPVQKWGCTAILSYTAGFKNFCQTPIISVTIVTKWAVMEVTNLFINLLPIVTKLRTTQKKPGFVTKCYKLLQTVTSFCHKFCHIIKHCHSFYYKGKK